MSLYKKWNDIEKAAWEYVCDFVSCGPENRIEDPVADVKLFITTIQEYSKIFPGNYAEFWDRIGTDNAEKIWGVAKRWLRACHWRETSAGIWEYDEDEAEEAGESGIQALSRIDEIVKW